MKVEVIPIEDRSQWMALRAQDVTASDVAAACGVSPFKTPLRLYAEKTGAIPPQDETTLMRRGRWLEPGIEAALRETFPSWDIRKADRYLRAPDLRIGATPDFVAIDPERPGFGNVQGKIVARRNFRDSWAPDDGPVSVPLYYQIQTLTEAKLLGASWALLAALVVGEFSAELVTAEVALSEGAWDRIVGEVAFFWRCIEAGTPPPVDPERDAETVRKLYPIALRDEEPVDLTARNDLPDLLDERERLKVQIRLAEARIDAIETDVRGVLGANAFAVASGWSISLRNEPRGEHVVRASNPRVLRVHRHRLAPPARSAPEIPETF